MGKMFQAIICLIFSIFIGLTVKKLHNSIKFLPIPELNLTKNWGHGDAKPDDPTIVPFKIDFPQEKIEKLKQQLTTQLDGLAPPLEGAKFEYGMNPKKLISIVNFWKDSYLSKFGDRLKYMNQFPQFKTQVQGLNIYFVHVKPKNPEGKKVVPILLLHGWPGSFLEFYEMIPLLTETGTDRVVFECIIPSLPGYGFSDATTKQGLGVSEMSIILRNLMVKLGKEKFYVQGGDWGMYIGKTMASLFPENVVGFHSNWLAIGTPFRYVKAIIATIFPRIFVDSKLHDFYFPISKMFIFLFKEAGHIHLEATKPDTIGIALSSNPIGLAAYILQIYSSWTNPSFNELENGGLDESFDINRLLDNIMIFYMTNSSTSSFRLYKEFVTDELFGIADRIEVKSPVGISRFRHEATHQIDWILQDKFTNIIYTNHHSDGGHFPALQYPEKLVTDIIQFVHKAENLAKKG